MIEGVDEFEVSVGPPYRSRLSERDPAVVHFDANLFNLAEPQPVDQNFTIGGVAAVRCDAIAVRICAADFDRRRDVERDGSFASGSCLPCDKRAPATAPRPGARDPHKAVVLRPAPVSSGVCGR
jgi:hypothetical protein